MQLRVAGPPHPLSHPSPRLPLLTRSFLLPVAQEDDTFAQANQTASEALTNIKTIAAFGMEGQVRCCSRAAVQRGRDACFLRLWCRVHSTVPRLASGQARSRRCLPPALNTVQLPAGLLRHPAVPTAGVGAVCQEAAGAHPRGEAPLQHRRHAAAPLAGPGTLPAVRAGLVVLPGGLPACRV